MVDRGRFHPLFDPPGSDPQLVSHYANDRELARLELDVQARVRAYQMASLWWSDCFCVCRVFTWPYMLCCFPFYEADVAAKHRLILREKTLLLEVDPYTQPCCAAEAAGNHPLQRVQWQ